MDFPKILQVKVEFARGNLANLNVVAFFREANDKLETLASYARVDFQTLRCAVCSILGNSHFKRQNYHSNAHTTFLQRLRLQFLK